MAWPNQIKQTGAVAENTENSAEAQKADTSASATNGETADIKIDAQVLDAAMRTACEAAIAAEPKLTQWDLIMGDGDCGEAVKQVCEGLFTYP